MSVTANPDLNSFSQEDNGNNVKNKFPGKPGGFPGPGMPYPPHVEVVTREVPYPKFDGLSRRDSERTRYFGPAGSQR